MDMPIWRLTPHSAACVRAALEDEVLPAMARVFGIARERLALREGFVAMYGTGGCMQRALGMHKDGTLLACTLLLNPESDFDGGGTTYAAPVRLREWSEADWKASSDWKADLSGPVGVIKPSDDDGGGGQKTLEEALVHTVPAAMGDLLLHCGQLRHGAAEVSRGYRYVLVAFVDELQLSPERRDERRDERQGEEVQGEGATGRVGPNGSPGLISTPSPGPISTPQPPSAAGAVPPLMARSVSLDGGTPKATSARSVPRLAKATSFVTPTSVGAAPGGERSPRRSCVSFHVSEIGGSSVPERRGKFTLPGGKAAFTPGWDEQPKIEDDEAELRAEINADQKKKLSFGS
jgi:hypothetical protein